MECESWTIKKTEHWRIDAFELWCWKRFFSVPWTAMRSNQSILNFLNIHWKDWCWSWNSKTLATWCEELTHQKRPWCWERLMTGGERGDRGWDGWMASSTLWIWVWASYKSWWWARKPCMLQSMGLQKIGHNWVNELNWTEHYLEVDFFTNRSWSQTWVLFSSNLFFKDLADMTHLDMAQYSILSVTELNSL